MGVEIPRLVSALPDEGFLGVEGQRNVLLRAADVAAVGLQIPGLGLIGKIHFQNLLQPPDEAGIAYGKMISTRWLKFRRIRSALPR